MNRDKFLEKSRSIHGYKYEYIDIPEKIIYDDVISIIYDGLLYKQKVKKHLIGKCPEKNTPKKDTETFIEESKLVWGDRFDYSMLEYNGSLKKIRIYDKQNNRFIEQEAFSHLQGKEYKTMDNDEFIESSKLVSDYKYSYEDCNYINKTTKVDILCEEHGVFSVLPFNHLNYGQVCNKCLFSDFNRDTKKFLNKYELPYSQQFKFSDMNLPFDFYLKSYRTCIDFTYEDTDENDFIKLEYCEDNYISLIKIRPNQLENINSILYENLKTWINI